MDRLLYGSERYPAMADFQLLHSSEGCFSIFHFQLNNIPRYLKRSASLSKNFMKNLYFAKQILRQAQDDKIIVYFEQDTPSIQYTI